MENLSQQSSEGDKTMKIDWGDLLLQDLHIEKGNDELRNVSSLWKVEKTEKQIPLRLPERKEVLLTP